MGNKVYYDSNKKIDIQRTMDGVKSELKGTTRDNYPIYHWTYYDTNRRCHISYDTLLMESEHEYILGSGHETNANSGTVSQWDRYVNSITWREAIGRYAKDCVKSY